VRFDDTLSVYEWSKILGKCASREVLRANYLRLARENHPDLGGSTERMATINVAMQSAEKHFARKRPTPARKRPTQKRRAR
jgi:hypothetical protein